jgi:hypothetical protein
MVVNKAYKALFESQARYLFVLGGAGAGKSYAIAQKLVLRMIRENGHKILVVRKVERTISNSVFSILKKCASILTNQFQYTISPKSIKFWNGNEFIFCGIDDPEKIKSIDGITGIWIEEGTELEEEDFDQLLLRMRGETANYKQIIFSFNPIDEMHWIKINWIDRDVKGLDIIHTTYKDNKFLDADYVNMLETENKKNEMLYRVYTLGEWGKVNTGAEYFKNFRQSLNTGDTKYNPDKPLCVSFDFNVNPYVSCSVWQIEGNHVMMIEELTLRNPQNTTKAACQTLLQMYPNHEQGVFVFGDPAGRARDTRTEASGNDYSIILQELRQWKPQAKVQRKAPSLNTSGMFINECFANNSPLKITIGSHCKLMIQDLLYLKQTADGGTLKEKVKDNKTGTTYEKYGHLSDGLRYFIIAAFEGEYNLWMKGGVKLRRV